MTGYRPRELGPTVRSALASMPVVVVTGPRQAGKSTFLQNESGLKDRHYRSLDDFDQLAAARADPVRFSSLQEPLTIDEAQRCPDLLLAIKRQVDRDRTPGRFLLSGSTNLDLLHQVTESLAGRAVHLALHPFTRRELRGDLTQEPFLRSFFASPQARDWQGRRVSNGDLCAGGMPPVALGLTTDPSMWFLGYEQTYLERDVRELARITDLVSFRNLLRLVAMRGAQVLNASELGRDAKLNSATVSARLAVLEASFLVNRLPPYLASRASRLIKSPKLYLADSGLAAHLCGVTEADLEAGDPLSGALLETYAAQNIQGTLAASWPHARLHFWNVQGRHEVDFVIERGRDTIAVEVKAAARWDDRDLRSLRAFLQHSPRCRAAILAHGGTGSVQLGDRLYALPLAQVLS